MTVSDSTSVFAEGTFEDQVCVKVSKYLVFSTYRLSRSMSWLPTSSSIFQTKIAPLLSNLSKML